MLLSSLIAFTLTLTLLSGNATFYGVDLPLVALVLHLCLFAPKVVSKFSFSHLIFALFTLSLMFALTIRSFTLGIDYYEQETYWLWAIKAYIGFYLIFFFNGLNWSEVSTTLLLFFAIILLVIGDVVDGRFYSIFGPNMLYRFFTLLALLGAYAISSSDKKLGFNIGCVLLGCFGVIITGSVGGIISLAGGLILILLVRFSLISFISGIILGALLFWFIANFVDYESISVIGRLLSKLIDISAESRYYMWGELADKDFKIFGYSYNELNDAWEYSFAYPHNIFLELVLFYGFAGMVVCIGLIISLCSAWRYSARRPEIGLIYYVLVSGSLLSGDLSDNYGAVALAMVFLGFLLTPPRNHEVAGRYKYGSLTR